MRLLLLILALLCSVSAALLTIWIVVPAPVQRLWMVALGASEWSLWFGALGLLGVVFSLLVLSARAAAADGRTLAWIALALGILSIVCAMYPPLSAWRAAREQNLHLSLGQYFFGSLRSQALRSAPQTRLYANAGGQPLALDVYLPEEHTATTTTTATIRPAIIVIHGGSWSAGEKSDFPQWDHWLSDQGYAVFDIQYRIAPQPNWQTAIGDVKCAISWVKRNAAQFKVDPERIALLGRSAGGHLALLAAYSQNEPSLPASCEATDLRVRAVISLYAPTDLAWGYEHPANPRTYDGPATLRKFLGSDPQVAADAYRIASPLSYINAQSPPTLLFHGSQDQLIRDRQMDFVSERLEAAHVPYRAVRIAYAQHGFDYNFNGWGSQIAQPIMLDFLRQYVER